MRFCDLFISYKIGLKNIKSTIPFTKLPLYRKIIVIKDQVKEVGHYTAVVRLHKEVSVEIPFEVVAEEA